MATLDAKTQASYTLAKFTRGFSGAELANVVNEAALLAGRKGARVSPKASVLVSGRNV